MLGLTQSHERGVKRSAAEIVDKQARFLTNEPLAGAAQLMIEHGVSHLVVREAASGYPVGVLSTLDIAAVYASGARR